MRHREIQIKALARANRIQREMPQFLLKLGQAGLQVLPEDALGSTDIDLSWSALRVGYKDAISAHSLSYRRYFSFFEENNLSKFADCFAQRMQSEKVLLLSHLDGDLIALRCDGFTAMSCWASILQIDGGSVNLLSLDLTQGILLDRNIDEKQEAFEVAIWGERWAMWSLECGERFTLQQYEEKEDGRDDSRQNSG